MNYKKIITLGLGVTALAAISVGSKFFGSVSIKGSDTMLPLNQQWAEVYGKKTGASIDVTGGGSGLGINAFINGATDICASSRPMRKSEIDKARSRGAVTNEIPVALDGLAIAVNDDNPVKDLTMDELRRIYIGQITNWNQVGGKNQPITTFSRDENSGTYAFFQTNVLKNQNWGPGVRKLASTSDEVREISRSEGGIAYGGVAYFKNKKGLKILGISPTKGGTPLMPTEDNVRSRKYPIWRFLYFYTNGAPKGETGKFIKWALSAEGQKIVEEVGYYSLH